MSPHTDAGELLPCPFCGNELYRSPRAHNPKAYCVTEDCYGKRMSVVNLDDPVCVAMWNTRQAASHGSAGGELADNDLGIVLSALRYLEDLAGEKFDDESGIVAQIEADYKARQPALIAASRRLAPVKTDGEASCHDHPTRRCTPENCCRPAPTGGAEREWDQGEHEGCGIDSQRAFAVEKIARAIAERGFGRAWDDFLPANAHDTDQGDLTEYAKAAVDALQAHREAIARALYKRKQGSNPDWPIGVDKNGYNQEPYVKTIPGWEWFYGADADAILALSKLTAAGDRTPFYGAECPSYPNCTGGCGLGCTQEIERARSAAQGAGGYGEIDALRMQVAGTKAGRDFHIDTASELLALLTAIIDSNNEFREGMPKAWRDGHEWEGDPLQDAIDAAHRFINLESPALPSAEGK